MKLSFTITTIFTFISTFLLSGCVDDLSFNTGNIDYVSFEKDGNIVSSVTVKQNADLGGLRIVVHGNPDETTNIIFDITSSNQALLPDESIVISGNGKFRDISAELLTDATGSTVLSGKVTDTDSGKFWVGSMTLIVQDVAIPTLALNDTGWDECGDYAVPPGGLSYENGYGTNDIRLDCQAVGVTRTVDGVDADGDIVPAGQDALYGRDVSHDDDSDGHAGFSFTKLDINGNPLASSATSWACVKDNVTGLIWEVKKDDGGLQDRDNTYTWFSLDSTTNGGDSGSENGGVCTGGNGCDTAQYVNDLNQLNFAAGICGRNDWRLPSRQELLSLVDASRVSPAVIDADYFPHTQRGDYWSSGVKPLSGGYATRVAFAIGSTIDQPKDGAFYVRLVSGESKVESGAGCTHDRNPNIKITKPDHIYIDHGDGTVTDQQTGLMWSKCPLGLSGMDCSSGVALEKTWQAALAEANASNLSGYSDWRLPNFKEADTLTEKACNNPQININLFPNTLYGRYWTASHYSNGPGWAYNWTTAGGISASFKDRNRFLRLVRDVK